MKKLNARSSVRPPDACCVGVRLDVLPSWCARVHAMSVVGCRSVLVHRKIDLPSFKRFEFFFFETLCGVNKSQSVVVIYSGFFTLRMDLPSWHPSLFSISAGVFRHGIPTED